MSGFHIEDVMLKYLINHKKRGGGGPLGPPLNPPLPLLVLFAEGMAIQMKAEDRDFFSCGAVYYAVPCRLAEEQQRQ